MSPRKAKSSELFLLSILPSDPFPTSENTQQAWVVGSESVEDMLLMGISPSSPRTWNVEVLRARSSKCCPLIGPKQPLLSPSTSAELYSWDGCIWTNDQSHGSSFPLSAASTLAGIHQRRYVRQLTRVKAQLQ